MRRTSTLLLIAIMPAVWLKAQTTHTAIAANGDTIEIPAQNAATTFSDVLRFLNAGESFYLTQDIQGTLADNSDGKAALPERSTVNIDLNGHTLDIKGSRHVIDLISPSTDLIRISRGATLNILNGSLNFTPAKEEWVLLADLKASPLFDCRFGGTLTFSNTNVTVDKSLNQKTSLVTMETSFWTRSNYSRLIVYPGTSFEGKVVTNRSGFLIYRPSKIIIEGGKVNMEVDGFNLDDIEINGTPESVNIVDISGSTPKVVVSEDNMVETLTITDGISLSDHDFYDKLPLKVTGEIIYERNFPNEWATIVVPFKLYSGEQYQLYSPAALTSDVLKLVPLDSVNAGHPAIIHVSPGIVHFGATNTWVSKGITNDSTSTFSIIGTYNMNTKVAYDDATLFNRQLGNSAAVDPNAYAISNNSFRRIGQTTGSTLNCNAYRAYLSLNATTPPVLKSAQFNLPADSELTGLNDATVGSDGESADQDPASGTAPLPQGKAYKLDGTLAPPDYRGVVIINKNTFLRK